MTHLYIIYAAGVFLYLVVFGKAFAADGDIIIEKMLVKSNVSMRFGEVSFQGTLRNLATVSKQTSFDITLPKSAFITEFSIIIDGVEHKAVVKEKNAALDEYNKALEDNETAGFVSQQSALLDDFDRDKFNIAVNIAPKSTASFDLRYQEMINRKGNVYKQRLYVNSKLTVAKIEVTFEITETQAFKSFEYRTPFTNSLRSDVIETTDDASGNYKKRGIWSPSTADLIENTIGENNAFDIVYDLLPIAEGGQLVMNNAGQFAHFFSTICKPENILPKRIVLVIDISGSMKGTPIKQVEFAMMSILDQLRREDKFNIILFSGNRNIWNKGFVQALPEHITLAKKHFENNLIAKGSTNINDAVLDALKLFDNADIDDENSLGMFGQIVVLLTDGEPTVGVRNPETIRQNVRDANSHGEMECCKASVFTVAFGQGSAKEFLQMLASENSGTIKIVREKNDETNHLALYEFFTYMENPYFKNVNFSFRVEGIPLPESNITQQIFPLFDCGEELIVAGWSDPNTLIEPRVIAESSTGIVSFDSVQRNLVTDSKADVLSKLIVYKHIKELLQKHQMAFDETVEEDIKQKALSLALKYGLVTPLTSMVVTSYHKERAVIRDDRLKQGRTKIGHHSKKNAIDHSRKNIEADDNQLMMEDGLKNVSCAPQSAKAFTTVLVMLSLLSKTFIYNL